jgi:hypothetical protein
MAAQDMMNDYDKAFNAIALSMGYNTLPDIMRKLEAIRFATHMKVSADNQKQDVLFKEGNLVDFIFQCALSALKNSSKETRDLAEDIHKFFKRARDGNDEYSLFLNIEYQKNNQVSFVYVNNTIEFSGRSEGNDDFIVSVANYSPNKPPVPGGNAEAGDTTIEPFLRTNIIREKDNYYKVKAYLISFFFLNASKLHKFKTEYTKKRLN